MDVQPTGIINCTGSAIRLYDSNKKKILGTLPKSEYVARLSLESSKKKVEKNFTIGRKRVKLITSKEEDVFGGTIKGLPPKKAKMEDILVSDAVGKELQSLAEKRESFVIHGMEMFMCLILAKVP